MSKDAYTPFVVRANKLTDGSFTYDVTVRASFITNDPDGEIFAAESKEQATKLCDDLNARVQQEMSTIRRCG